MRAHRRLTLHKETLTELRTDELSLVLGGAALPTDLANDCIGVLLSKVVAECESRLRPCISHTCTR